MPLASLSQHHGLLIQWGVVVGASLAAALWDIRTRRIPNAMTGPLLLCGLIWSSWWGGWMGLGSGIAGAAVAALPFVLLFIFAGGGAGDAKIMLALGAWLGLRDAVILTCAVAIAGGLIAVIVGLCVRRSQTVSNFYNMVLGVLAFGWSRKVSDLKAFQPEHSQMTPMPYGPAIFVGACVAAGVALKWGTALT